MALRSSAGGDSRFQAYLGPHLAVALRVPAGALSARAEVAELTIGRYLDIRVGDEAVVDGLVPGQRAEVSFARVNDATYRFTTTVSAVHAEPGERCVRLDWPGEVSRCQSRRHVRLPILLDVDVAPAGPRRLGAAGSWQRAVGVDISASGIGIVADNPITPGTTVMARTTVPGRQAPVDLDLRATVVRCLPARERNAAAGHRIGLAFLELPSRIEQDLVGTVFWHLTRSRVVG